ncbi:helix-turn-helix transcriptional regulator [Virgisporangium aurantiacum]|uniref:Transcriptional regulator n=1 Tax=Virgisporangium aurantiacum TaxID=175570 RepID=A0A8J3ZG15_9ACTN|nr:helix-turn-helix transcriptional regulator [Virgisporangium aurantiacum]GIJ62118.1 transcriptional regulator [Virgisporangium aurantiacum]
MQQIDPEMTPAERIKLFRMRAGLTQEQAAQLKGCTVSAWRKWESGERSVNSLGDWIEIARIVRVKDLFRLTGLPLGELPDEPSEHETIPPIRSAMHAYPQRLDEPVDLDLLGRSLDFAWGTWHGSGSRYTRTGPMLPDLITDTRAALISLDDAEDRRRGQRLAMHLWSLIRAYGKRIGALDVAMVAADRASTAADNADDPCYRAAAAWHTATVLSASGHTEEAAALCRDAVRDLEGIDDQDPERIALVGVLHLLLAVQEARLRSEPAAMNALAVADRAAVAVGETTYHRVYFGPTNVGIHRSAVALELSRPHEALRVAEHVDVSQSPSVERRYAHYLHLARGYANRREDLAALHMLLRGDRECAEESKINLTVKGLTRELLRRETPTTRPELRPFAERIGVA